MVVLQSRSRRRHTGGAYKSTLPKRTHAVGRMPTMTKLGTRKVRRIRTKGGGAKDRVLQTDAANVFDPKSGKAAQLKISNVAENPANRYYVRRNILTKGTVIETEKGKARVTSRPGQDGTVNAVLL